jgi:tRNA A-37 threonylcarbamoyl transferase component Bud32
MQERATQRERVVAAWRCGRTCATLRVMDCPVCKAPLDGSPKFCAGCGASTEPGASSATAAAPATEVEPRFDPFLGQTVAGRYKITRLLGEGGMGAVYIGEQNIGGTVRKVAIKTLHAHLSKDPKILQRFERECATVAELQHPNTIQLYDFGKTDDGILYMVMEFVQGESLAAVLEKRKSLEPARAQHILQQICDALGEAHSLGIVHRDLKPDNIVLTERAKDWVKVLDFGIAKRSEAQDKEEQKLTQQGTVLGTPPYMSPEQFTGRPIDARSDIYSIAIIAYEMVAGHLPFNASTPWEWATQHMTVAPQPLTTSPSGGSIPESMIYAIMRSLSKDPNERFATTKEFFDALSFTVEGPATSGSYAPASVIATGGAGAMLEPMRPPGNLSPALGMMGAVAPPDPRGKTQLGGGTQGPPPGAAAYGAPPGAAYGAPTGPARPFAPAPYGTPAGGNFAVPAPRKPRSGGGAIIAVLAVGGLLAAGGAVFALTRGPTSPSSGGSSAPGATDTTQPGDGGNPNEGGGGGAQAVANDRHHRHLPPLIDTALPSLSNGADPADRHRADNGPPANTPPPPAGNDSKACKTARNLQTRIAQETSPTPKLMHNFNKERAKCISEGGHL